MLSRHAESLFWFGRYLERAEYSTRMLDVTYHALLESAAWESERAWRDLLRVLRSDGAFDGDGQGVTSESVSRFVMLAESNHDSVLGCIERARENARSVRELIPTELWQAVNSFYLALGARDLAADLREAPYDLYDMVKLRCQTVSGVLSDTMARDDGWRFVTIGRSLERSQITCRLLAVRYRSMGEVSFHQWLAALRSATAAESFRKAYRGSMNPRDVIEFLLLSPVFPRSVFFCLRSAEVELVILGSWFRRVTRPQRLLGRIRAGLEFCDVDELVQDDLGAQLDQIESDIRWVAESIALEYFRNSHEFAPFVPSVPAPSSARGGASS